MERIRLTVAEARVELDAWAHEHNEMVAARAKPGFWEWVRKHVATSLAQRHGSAALRQRTANQSRALLSLLRARAVHLSGDDRYWTADGQLRVMQLAEQVAGELAVARDPMLLKDLHADFTAHVDSARGTDSPERNLLRSFRKWLALDPVTWPTREAASAERLVDADPAVALYQREREAARKRAANRTGV